MLVAASRTRLLYFLLTVSILIFCYFGFVSEIVVRPREFKRQSSKDKKIVAFSFLKQIEIESEEIECEKILVPQKLKSENFSENKRWIQLEGTDLFIYSVHKDSRLYPYEYVRIIGMIKGGTNSSIFCQISTTNGTIHVTRAIVTKIWSKTWNQNDRHTYYNPYLVSCHVPINTTPIHVSLSEVPCQINPQKFSVSTTKAIWKNDTFTICVKPLNFNQDISERLLQWIVINQILGATKIEFYIENLHNKTVETLKKVEKVFRLVLNRHYKIDYNFSSNEAIYIWQKRRYEIITYNDCFYRNIHTSQFVIPIDIDEVIVPRHVTTWAELLDGIVPKGEDNFASYTVRNAYYLRQFNMKKTLERVFFFRDVNRSEFSDEGESGKSFISTKNALTVFNHYALEGLTPGVGKNKYLKNDLVQMNHYKNECDIVILPECAKYLSSRVRIVDGVILKYKKEFYKRYENMLNL